MTWDEKLVALVSASTHGPLGEESSLYHWDYGIEYKDRWYYQDTKPRRLVRYWLHVDGTMHRWVLPLNTWRVIKSERVKKAIALGVWPHWEPD